MNRELFKELVDRYIAGQATDEEKAFIEAYYAGFEVRPNIIGELSSSEQFRFEKLLYQDILSTVASADPTHFKEKIGQKVNDTPPVHRIHFLKKWGWAAAVLLFIGIGAYLFTTTKHTEKPDVAIHHSIPDEIPPGTNKAVLTLSDGTTITLDSAANGAIAQQGNSSIVKLSNGEIRYDLKGVLLGEVMMNTMATPKGGQYQLVLPDGTKVWLNAASSITYPAAFVGNDRQVKVTGEVYMEVAKDKTKPFTVDVDGQSSVQVLGTSFNINSYKDDGHIKTTLIDGSVKVNNQVVLKPGEQAVQSVNGISSVRVNDQAKIEQVLAWKNGYFSFENMGLREMARQIERWYDVKVEFVGAFNDISLKGEMDRGVKLSGIVRFFESYGFTSSLEGRVLTLKRAGL